MVFPKLLEGAYDRIEKYLRASDIIAGKSGRHMKFPYTMSAKIAQFPYFLYMKKNFIWMYYPFGFLGALYVFSIIHEMANSEGNKRSWAESQRKIAEKEHHH
ncbi:hypothetical protein O3G_MSEX001321 [Manduca sexta]|uniref:Uncharacterized protein n=1 Tax=Manduca sexta TaxID=7130 RepID=A0A921YK31_MANSE|nr:hypothetical protein O3G_MSEX001321 [Manduca sexta]